MPDFGQDSSHGPEESPGNGRPKPDALCVPDTKSVRGSESWSALNWLYWPNMALVCLRSTPKFRAPPQFLKISPFASIKMVVGIPNTL